MSKLGLIWIRVVFRLSDPDPDQDSVLDRPGFFDGWIRILIKNKKILHNFYNFLFRLRECGLNNIGKFIRLFIKFGVNNIMYI